MPHKLATFCLITQARNFLPHCTNTELFDSPQELTTSCLTTLTCNFLPPFTNFLPPFTNCLPKKCFLFSAWNCTWMKCLLIVHHGVFSSHGFTGAGAPWAVSLPAIQGNGSRISGLGGSFRVCNVLLCPVTRAESHREATGRSKLRIPFNGGWQLRIRRSLEEQAKIPGTGLRIHF